MSKDLLKEWLIQFRSDAESDALKLLDDHIDRLSEVANVVPGVPKRLMDGTVNVVVACCAYWGLDSDDCDRTKRFLESQKYSLWERKGNGYVFTFDLHSMAYGSIRIEDALMLGGYMDLADLYGHPWWEYERIGYDNLYVTRSDWGEFSAPELELIESQIIEDIRYDYSEDELNMWTELSDESNCFIVHLQDGYDEDD